MRRIPLMLSTAAAAAVLTAACGGAGATVRTQVPGQHTGPNTRPTAHSRAAKRASVPTGNWTTFDYNSRRNGVDPNPTGITAANAHTLKTQKINLDGTVDASVVELGALKIHGSTRPVIFFTTDYGQTEALDARTGRRLWQFTPAGFDAVRGTAQITTATPIIDAGHHYVYAAASTGYIFKLNILTGRKVWGTRVTYDPHREKIAGALNITGKYLLTETDGYDGDTPTYQGHVVLIDRSSGRIAHVWNSLCSNIHHLINPPSQCSGSDSAIWGRPGAVVVPGSGDILVATGNGPFDGHTDWGDSVLKLSPSLKLLQNWTPTDQAALNTDDLDLGSTEPALLPDRHGVQLAVQGGKSGILSLLNINRLDGTKHGAGPRTGGQLQQINGPGPTDIFSQPAVYTTHGTTYVYVTDGAGTAAYIYDSKNRLRPAWSNSNAGTSPVIADGLLYVYNEYAGDLEVMSPRTGHVYASLPAASGHWNSPTIVGGRIFLPVGDDNNQYTSGQLYIYHLPTIR